MAKYNYVFLLLLDMPVSGAHLLQVVPDYVKQK